MLIVDDEPTIRKGLSYFIQWDSIDCIVDDTACDGAEAIDKINELHPDIVITDIKMPQVDGIELSKYIYENHPNIQTIILTGYADFQYAQSAIKYNIIDFILKPTSKDKLIEAVKSAQERILTLQKKTTIEKEDISFLKEQLLQELTNNSNISTNLLSRMNNYGINLDHYYYAVAFEFAGKQTGSGNDDINSLKNIITSQHENYYCYRYNNLVIALYPMDGFKKTVPQSVLKGCEEMLEIIHSLYSLNLSVGISLCHTGYDQLSLASIETITALSLNFYNNKDICIYEPSLENSSYNINTEYTLSLYHIETLLKNWDFDGAFVLINTLFSQLKLNIVKSVDVKNICTQIYYICSRILIKRNLTPMHTNVLIDINECATIFQLEKLTKEFLENVKSNITTNGKVLSPNTEKSIHYIHLHLKESLSLETIASYIHINPSHLSRTFKKESGESITEYINKARIEKAQELLSLSNTRAYEVAELVGFNDPAYFSATFKKYTGLSPKEYKQLRSQGK